jgi:hypothetical protein
MLAHFFTADFVLWLVKLLVKLGVAGGVLTALYWAVGKMSDRAKTFFVGVFSESGTPSFSRVATGLIVISAICWISFIVYETRGIPDVGGVILLIGTLYGVNVAGATVSKFSNGQVGPKP